MDNKKDNRNKISYLSDESDHDVSHVKHLKESGISAAKPLSIDNEDSQNNDQIHDDSFESKFLSTDSDKFVDTELSNSEPIKTNLIKEDSVTEEIKEENITNSFSLSDLKKEEIETQTIAKVSSLALESNVEENSNTEVSPITTNTTHKPDLSSYASMEVPAITPHPQNEIHVGDKPEKQKRSIPGLGILKSIFWKLYSCMGCLLFIIAIAIVLFVYLINI